MTHIPETLRNHMDFQLSLINLLKEPHASVAKLLPASAATAPGLNNHCDVEGKLAELKAACA